MKIKSKIILSFLISVVVIAFFSFVVIRYISKNIVIELIGDYNTLLSENNGRSIDRLIYYRLERWESYMGSNREILELLNSSNEKFDQITDRDNYIKNQDELWRNSDGDKTSELMGSIIKNPFSEGLRDRINFYTDKYGYDIFPEIFITNKYGVNVAQSQKTSDYNQADEVWWQKAKNEKLYVSDVVYDESSHINALELSIRIDDSENNFLGVAKIVYNIKDIFQIIDEIVQNSTSEIFDANSNFSRETVDAFLLTKEGKLIYSANNGFGNFVDKSVYLDKFNIKEKHLPYLVIKENGEDILFSHSDLLGYKEYRGLDWTLFISKNTKEVFLPLVEINKGIGFVNLISLGVSIIIAFFIARFLSKPINKLLSDTEIFEQGDLNHKSGTNSKDEIGQLSRSFDKMILSIKKSRQDVDRKVEEQTKEIVQKGKDMEDQQKAILNILEDVEEEKQKVSLEKDRIDAILHSIGDGVFVVNSNLEIILINQVALDLCGYSLEESLGKKYDKVLNFVFEGDKQGKINNKFVKDAIATGEVQEMANHTMLVTKDGLKISVADSAAPLKDSNQKILGCVVVFRDVTKEREVDRMKTEFISLASHQLRTPLSAMKWFCEMLLNNDAGKLNKEQFEFVTNISQSNERMIALVNSLLNISRIESGRIIIDPKPTDVKKLVEEILAEIKNNIAEKKQQITVKIDSSLPKVNIDPKLTGEVYKNLLTNANKYTSEKGKISITVTVKDDFILSQISDNGVGIPKKDQKLIFEKFYRAENIVKLETEGTGLGLYLAKSIVESSGGKIWFESKEEEGSSFWFTIPLVGVKPKKGEVGLDS